MNRVQQPRTLLVLWGEERAEWDYTCSCVVVPRRARI